MVSGTGPNRVRLTGENAPCQPGPQVRVTLVVPGVIIAAVHQALDSET